MATKLGLYNAALAELGQRKLASVSEARAPRYYLDDCYSSVLRFCLEQGQWKFAMRAQELASSPSVDPAFGFAYAFEKPDDWIRTSYLCSDDRLSQPLVNYMDEGAYWYADIDPLYIKYVSDDTAYGLDLSLWPATFERYVTLVLASRIVLQEKDSKVDLEILEKKEKRAKSDALSKDAMNEGPRFLPSGSWVRSRMGSASSYRNPERA